ncbi:MAG: PLP-dependent aminotransferase family protein [Rhodobacteraceae bacterium]|nr:PLP-dependent aminotransferase family protein [Paracoccaceae bacterium]
MDTIWAPELLQNGTAKYRALLNAIRYARDNGNIKVGDQLPPVREMAYQLKITPGTVARAYQLGIDEGILEAQIGRGTFVRRPARLTPKTVRFGETHVDSDIVDLRNAAVPDFGQDVILDDLAQKIEFGGTHSVVRYAGHNEMPTRGALLEWTGLDVLRAKAEDLVLTYGSQNATLAAFLAILRGPAPVIATDLLVLPGTRRAAELVRAKVIGLPSDEHGMIPKTLEDLCRTERPQILHLFANINNPTAKITPAHRKAEIAEIARRYDLQIVEDDGQSKFFHERPLSFLDFCPERVWHVSSLSRYLAAGLRIGFLLCPPGKGALGLSITQSMSHSFSSIIAQLSHILIQSGQADILVDLIREYRSERVKMAVNQLGRWQINWHEAADYIWLDLPGPWRASSFSMAAERAGIEIAPADVFLPTNGVAPNAVRLTLGGKHSAEVFTNALQKLDQILDAPPTDFLS